MPPVWFVNNNYVFLYCSKYAELLVGPYITRRLLDASDFQGDPNLIAVYTQNL